MAGNNWSGNNWTAGHCDGNNWLGPNGESTGPTYADMGAVITASGAVVAQARGTARLGALAEGAGAIVLAALETNAVVDDPVFEQTAFAANIRRRQERYDTAARVLGMLVLLTIPMIEAIEEDEWAP